MHLKLSIVLLSSLFISSTTASHLSNHHGVTLKRKRNWNVFSNRSQLIAEDPAELQKRDGTKYVFMHHVNVLSPSASCSVNLHIYFWLDCRQWVSFLENQTKTMLKCSTFLFSVEIKKTRKIHCFPNSYLQLKWFIPSKDTLIPLPTGLMTWIALQPKGCEFSVRVFLKNQV